jgi:hypothetical protein
MSETYIFERGLVFKCHDNKVNIMSRREAGTPTPAPPSTPSPSPSPPSVQGLTLVHVSAQLEQLQDTFMS